MSLFGVIKGIADGLRETVENLTRREAEQDASLAALEARVKALEEASAGDGNAPETGARGAARGRGVKAKPSAAAGETTASGT